MPSRGLAREAVRAQPLALGGVRHEADLDQDRRHVGLEQHEERTALHAEVDRARVALAQAAAPASSAPGSRSAPRSARCSRAAATRGCMCRSESCADAGAVLARRDARGLPVVARVEQVGLDAGELAAASRRSRGSTGTGRRRAGSRRRCAPRAAGTRPSSRVITTSKPRRDELALRARARSPARRRLAQPVRAERARDPCRRGRRRSRSGAPALRVGAARAARSARGGRATRAAATSARRAARSALGSSATIRNGASSVENFGARRAGRELEHHARAASACSGRRAPRASASPSIRDCGAATLRLDPDLVDVDVEARRVRERVARERRLRARARSRHACVSGSSRARSAHVAEPRGPHAGAERAPARTAPARAAGAPRSRALLGQALQAVELDQRVERRHAARAPARAALRAADRARARTARAAPALRPAPGVRASRGTPRSSNSPPSRLRKHFARAADDLGGESGRTRHLDSVAATGGSGLHARAGTGSLPPARRHVKWKFRTADFVRARSASSW